MGHTRIAGKIACTVEPTLDMGVDAEYKYASRPGQTIQRDRYHQTPALAVDKPQLPLEDYLTSHIISICPCPRSTTLGVRRHPTD